MKDNACRDHAEFCFAPKSVPFVFCPNDNSYFWLESLWMSGAHNFHDEADNSDETMDEERCPHCDKIVPPDAEKCSHCGSPLNMSLYQRVG